MGKARRKSIAANVDVPQDRDQAATFLRRIGEMQRAIASIERRLNDRIAVLKDAAEREAAQKAAEVTDLTKGLQIWCEANRAVITDGGKVKSADLGTGKVSWRLAPPKVTIRDLAAVLTALKDAGLARFVRTKEEVDREAMLREPEAATAVAGVTIKSDGEDFAVEPFAIELSGAAA